VQKSAFYTRRYYAVVGFVKIPEGRTCSGAGGSHCLSSMVNVARRGQKDLFGHVMQHVEGKPDCTILSGQSVGEGKHQSGGRKQSSGHSFPIPFHNGRRKGVIFSQANQEINEGRGGQKGRLFL